MTRTTRTLLAGLLATALLLSGGSLAAQDGTILGRTVGFLTGGPPVSLGPTSCAAGAGCQNGCQNGCGGSCDQCCRQWDTFGSVEFLLWWAKGTGVPPLVSDGPLPPGTVLFGDQLLASKARAGGRLTAGIWLDPEHNVAAGGRFFGLGGDTTRFFASSDGTTPLARPFFDALLNVPSSFLVASPGISAGNVSAFGSTNNILGAEAFTEIMMQRDERRRIDLVAGYQFLRLNDWVQIDSQTQAPLPPLPPINTLSITDRFSTHNQFHGGEFGLRGRMARGQWSADVLGLFGLGNMNEQVTIFGQTDVNGLTNPGGILAQNTNMGVHTRNRFTFIPQLTANLKYHFTPNASVHIGYNIIWISNIVTAGDQIDSVVNSSQIGGGPLVGPARPAFAFHDNDYWLQGINFGANWDF